MTEDDRSGIGKADNHSAVLSYARPKPVVSSTRFSIALFAVSLMCAATMGWVATDIKASRVPIAGPVSFASAIGTITSLVALIRSGIRGEATNLFLRFVALVCFGGATTVGYFVAMFMAIPC